MIAKIIISARKPVESEGGKKKSATILFFPVLSVRTVVSIRYFDELNE